MSGLTLINEISNESVIQKVLIGTSGTLSSGVIMIQAQVGDVIKCKSTALIWEEEVDGGGSTHSLDMTMSDVVSASQATYRTVTAWGDEVENVDKDSVGEVSIEYHTLRTYSTRVITGSGLFIYGVKVVYEQANTGAVNFERGIITVEHYRPTLPFLPTNGDFPAETTGSRWNLT